MSVYIQDTNFEGSVSLHEALLSAMNNAVEGAGVYAFVTTGGVHLLLENEKFQEFMRRGKYKLIVGIDELTNTKTLTKLRALSSKYEGNLEVFAFLNKNINSSLFHPKFSWFQDENGGYLITSSGNLTEKGLRKNREIFSVEKVSIQELNEAKSLWNDWLESNCNLLKELDDTEVLEQAVKNERFLAFRREGNRNSVNNNDELENIAEVDGELDSINEVVEENDNINTSEILEVEDEDIEAWAFTESDDILVHEIPRNGDRFKQVNFNKSVFNQFFGAQTITEFDNINIFKNVLPDGSVEVTEERPFVKVKSDNYRFELGALAGRTYPSEGRPIGVFIRVATRMFLYTVVMPNNDYFEEVKQYLYKYTTTTRVDRMKVLNANVADTKEHCPSLPFWKLIEIR